MTLRSLVVVLALTGTSIAVATPESAPDDAADTAATNTTDGNTAAAIDTASRRVYTVDDVGMIIGGASEDAKAKVRRLPVQK